MEEIMKEIEEIISGLQQAIEDKEITEENLRDDIKSLLEDKVVDLIKDEIESI